MEKDVCTCSSIVNVYYCEFFEEAPPGKYPWTKGNILSLVFFSIYRIPKIKVCHMLAKVNPDMFDGRKQLIAVDVIGSEEAAEDASIGHYSAA